MVVATVSLLYLQTLRISCDKFGADKTSPKGERKGGFHALFAWAVVLAATRAMAAVGHMTPQHRLEPPDTFPGSTDSPIPTLARHAESIIGGEAWLLLGMSLCFMPQRPISWQILDVMYDTQPNTDFTGFLNLYCATNSAGSAAIAAQSLPLPGVFSSTSLCTLGAALILTWHVAEVIDDLMRYAFETRRTMEYTLEPL